MRQNLRLLTVLLVVIATGCFAFRRTPPGFPRETPAVAPDSFDVEMATTKGTLVVRVHRAWSPNGADRFYIDHGDYTVMRRTRIIANRYQGLYIYNYSSGNLSAAMAMFRLNVVEAGRFGWAGTSTGSTRTRFAPATRSPAGTRQ